MIKTALNLRFVLQGTQTALGPAHLLAATPKAALL
jgi:hypothetical protein